MMERYFVAGPFSDGRFVRMTFARKGNPEFFSVDSYVTRTFAFDKALLKTAPDSWSKHMQRFLDQVGDTYKWPTKIFQKFIPTTIDDLPEMPENDLSQPCCVPMEFTKEIHHG